MPVSEEWLAARDRIFQTGQTESHVEPQLAESPVLLHASTLWSLMSGEGCVGVMMQPSNAIHGHEEIVAMGEVRGDDEYRGRAFPKKPIRIAARFYRGTFQRRQCGNSIPLIG